MSDRFGPQFSPWTLAEGLRDELKAWFAEYLRAGERASGLAAAGRRTNPQISWRVRHQPRISSNEVAHTAAAVIWIAGVTDHTTDPDRTVTGTVQVGVLLAARASNLGETGDLLHRYSAAVRALLLDRRTAGGHCQDLDLVDEDTAPFDPEAEQTLAGIALSYEAFGVLLGRKSSGPPPGAVPRPNPDEPWPLAPTVETADAQIVPIIDPED